MTDRHLFDKTRDFGPDISSDDETALEWIKEKEAVSETKWKFCEKDFFNLDEVPNRHVAQALTVFANKKIQEWLKDSVEVMAHRGPSNPQGVWIAKPYQDADATHSARLIMIEPIAKADTAESLLRERSDFHAEFNDRTASPGEAAWLERVRKLLKEGEG